MGRGDVASANGALPASAPGVPNAWKVVAAHRGRTVSTGQGAWRTTRSATLPIKKRATAVRPWVPMIIRSRPFSSAYSIRFPRAEPTRTARTTFLPPARSLGRAAASALWALSRGGSIVFRKAGHVSGDFGNRRGDGLHHVQCMQFGTEAIGRRDLAVE